VGGEDEAGFVAGGDAADGIGVGETGGAGVGGGTEDGSGGHAGAFHEFELEDEAETVGDAYGAGVATGNDLHAHLVGFDEGGSVVVENALEVADDLFVPAEAGRVIDLQLHGGEGGNPGDVEVAEFGELVVAEEESVFDRVDAAVDGVVDADVAGGVGKGLATVTLGGSDDGSDFGGIHLGLGGNDAFLEVNDAGREKFDPVGAIGDAGIDAGIDGGVVLDRGAHELTVATRVVDGRAWAVEVRHDRSTG